jgi:hypothetical protein
MAQTVTANKLTISHKGTVGLEMCSAPDVCKTPAAPSPIPVPYMIVSKSADLTGGTTTVDADGGNSVAVQGSKHATCMGDQPGSLGGVVSGVFGQASDWLSFSPTVSAQGKAICRLTDKLMMNNKNTVAGPGGHMVLPAVVTDPVEKELCDSFCRARKNWLDSGKKAPRPSKRAEKLVQAKLDDKNSALNKAIQAAEPGGKGAAEKTFFVKAPASFKNARSVRNKTQVRASMDRNLKRAQASGIGANGAAVPVKVWKQNVRGMNSALEGRTGKMTAAEVREAMKAPGAVAPTSIKAKPDFAIMDKDGKPTQIYDFKFDDPKGSYKDQMQSNRQEDAYKLASGKDVIVIDEKKCGCRPKGKETKKAEKAAKAGK